MLRICGNPCAILNKRNQPIKKIIMNLYPAFTIILNGFNLFGTLIVFLNDYKISDSSPDGRYLFTFSMFLTYVASFLMQLTSYPLWNIHNFKSHLFDSIKESLNNDEQSIKLMKRRSNKIYKFNFIVMSLFQIP